MVTSIGPPPLLREGPPRLHPRRHRSPYPARRVPLVPPLPACTHTHSNPGNGYPQVLLRCLWSLPHLARWLGAGGAGLLQPHPALRLLTQSQPYPAPTQPQSRHAVKSFMKPSDVAGGPFPAPGSLLSCQGTFADPSRDPPGQAVLLFPLGPVDYRLPAHVGPAPTHAVRTEASGRHSSPALYSRVGRVPPLGSPISPLPCRMRPVPLSWSPLCLRGSVAQLGLRSDLGTFHRPCFVLRALSPHPPYVI